MNEKGTHVEMPPAAPKRHPSRVVMVQLVLPFAASWENVLKSGQVARTNLTTMTQ
jgi:hypothetical protein